MVPTDLLQCSDRTQHINWSDLDMTFIFDRVGIIENCFTKCVNDPCQVTNYCYIIITLTLSEKKKLKTKTLHNYKHVWFTKM